ncbi:MAG: carboxypeptidase regulatory-like domain-containing protein [Prevotellaceae bacterium]|jgi:outer membrane protein OmpA-like peptidoglycan-associated protein/tetratricopeptide (TPR) repeat protein|nr:carboxypeptidase regulatory-like domain-containing protein [Prevotellaceae bacterium]
MSILNRRHVLAAIAFMMITSISAQNVKFEYSNFPGRENDLNNALSAIDQGEKFLFEAETMLLGKGIDLRHKAKALDMISKGLELFLQANAFNPESAQLNYTIGKSYLYVEDYEQSLKFLRKAMLLDEKGFKDIQFLVGRIYQQMGDFELAIESYNTAARSYGSDIDWSSLISAKVKECRYAQELMSDAVDVRVENMGVAMNTASMEYFPIITSGDEILLFERFSSGKNKLYAAERTANGWRAAVETNQSFLLPQKEKETLTELTLVDKNGIPAITRWFAINAGSQQQIEQDYYESLAASSKSYAIFSSNRYEGAGGFDIFISQSNKKGQWERPRSFGEINTEGDEYGVVLHPSGHTLFFSSNGHQTMGGYDIFKSEYDGKNWSKPENLGYPINSTADDIVYSISEDGNRLYFSSNRTSGKGGYDVYLVNFMPDVLPSRRTETAPMNVSAEAIGIIAADEPLTVSEISTAPTSVVSHIVAKYPAAMHGFISDNQTYAPLSSVTVRLLDRSNNAEEVIETDNKGVFYATLSAGGSYRIAVDIPGYQPYEEDFKISEEVGQKLSKNISLSPLAGEGGDVVAEALPEQPATVAPESEGEYEDVVVLTPILAGDQPQPQVQAVTEYPVTVTALIADSETFAPIPAAQIKVTLKDSDDEHIFESDNKGLLNFYLASGNTYVITTSAANYENRTEEIALPAVPDQKLSKTFQLQAIPPVVVAEVIPEPVNLVEEEALLDEEPEVTAPIVELVPVPVLVEEPEVEPEPEVEIVPEPVPVVVPVAEEPEPAPAPQEVQPEPEPVVEPAPEPVVVPVPEPELKVVPEPVPVIAPVAEEFEAPQPVEEITIEETPVEESLYEEDVVVLAPVLALAEGDEFAVENKEYPVNLKIYVSDSQTMLPLAVPVKLAVKNTDMENHLTTDEKGMLDVTIASGNAYHLEIEYEGYAPVTEDFDVAKGPGQNLNRNIVLTSLTPVATPVAVAEAIPVEEEQPVITEEPVVEVAPEPVIENEIVAIEETPEPEVAPVAPVAEEPVVEVAPEPVVEKVTKEAPQPKKAEEKTPATEVPAAPAVLAFSGTIVSADTKKPVTTAVVTLTDATRGITETVKVSEGKFNANALSGSNYSIKITANGYQTVVRDVATSAKDKKIDIPVELHPVTETFVAAIYFDFDRAALNEKAEQTLKEVIANLKQGKKVYLAGYTDNAGGQGYNKRLAERRVETISTYLRVHGIAAEDIAASWKGISNPAETNFTPSGRKLNNRVEIWMK